MVPYILLYSIHPTFVTLVFSLWTFIKIPPNNIMYLYALTMLLKRLYLLVAVGLWPRPQIDAGTPIKRRALIKRPRLLFKNRQFWPGVFFETSVKSGVRRLVEYGYSSKLSAYHLIIFKVFSWLKCVDMYYITNGLGWGVACISKYECELTLCGKRRHPYHSGLLSSKALLVFPKATGLAQTFARDTWNEYCDTCDLTDSMVFCWGWKRRM